MISSASHDSVSRRVADRSMCLATALDKTFENTERLIQPRRPLCHQLPIRPNPAYTGDRVAVSILQSVASGWRGLVESTIFSYSARRVQF